MGNADAWFASLSASDKARVRGWLLRNPRPLAWQGDELEWAFCEGPDPRTVFGRALLFLDFIAAGL